MIPALVTLGLGLATTSIVGLVAFLYIRDAERRCADARVDAQLNVGKLALAAADVTTWKYKALTEARRADALDDLINKHSGGDAGPIVGSMDRLLEEWRSARKVAAAADSTGTEPVSQASTAAVSGPKLELVKPGDV